MSGQAGCVAVHTLHSLPTRRHGGCTSPWGGSLPSGLGDLKHKQGPWAGSWIRLANTEQNQEGEQSQAQGGEKLLLQLANQTRPNHVTGSFPGSLQRVTQPEKPANYAWSFSVALSSQKTSPDWPNVDKWTILLSLKGNLIPFKFKSLHSFLTGLGGAHVEINKFTVCSACFHYHFLPCNGQDFHYHLRIFLDLSL